MAERPCKDPSLFHLNRSTNRFSAWVRRPSAKNKRYYIGCYTTFHMAARAQDRATLYISPDAPINFKASDYEDDATLRTTMDEKAFLKMLRDESRPIYKVVAKSPCFARFQRMEDHMEDLRQLTNLTIREFVAHLARNPTQNPEVNRAATTLLEIFSTHTAGTDDTTEEEDEAEDESETEAAEDDDDDDDGPSSSSPKFDTLANILAKGKRSLRHKYP